MTERQARGLIDAVVHAERLGLSLNRLTTIHWEAAGVSDGLAATMRFLKLLGDALRYQGEGFAYVWVREDGHGKGEHVHILWYGPPDFPPLRRRLRHWLKACGAKWREGVCDTRAIGRTLRQALTGGEDYAGNLKGTLDYVLKAAHPVARARLDIGYMKPGGGLIVGKRAGVSQNLGPAARAKWASR